ncbi:hypothetical protein ACFPAF_16680 [Hymenobacter endophyticus]|uniref:CcoQ/FixQ family Cbb3-type cytochrome c oxidase assembly chaperone n=1 Tax=Hymenobacter endophyticus TaxID=3076335 RepID=A0ABU3TKZ3_9BACT|nr:hypothetical protein [Hymenobacter endophyticus]MDU0372041.1 hypothetical protein [Hymenobacter endophyticus]
MDKKVLQSIAGVEIYPLISLAIFFLFFLGLLVYVVRANRQHLREMSEMPLRADDETPQPALGPDVLC